MRIIVLGVVMAVFPVLAGAQVPLGLDWQKAGSAERKEMMKKMSPEEKREILKQFRESMMLEELQIQERDREAFRMLYGEYQDSQRRIKDRFSKDFNPDELTEAEAKTKLEESFSLGQALLDHRREYARKMEALVGSKKVLKMFQNEWKMRDRMMDRRMEMHGEGEKGKGYPPKYSGNKNEGEEYNRMKP